jgi:hypothetical protein
MVKLRGVDRRSKRFQLRKRPGALAAALEMKFEIGRAGRV